MTDLTTRFADRITVDRDYAGAVGEDVQLRLWGDFDEDPFVLLSADDADELADALKHHAAEVRQINKENGLA